MRCVFACGCSAFSFCGDDDGAWRVERLSCIYSNSRLARLLALPHQQHMAPNERKECLSTPITTSQRTPGPSPTGPESTLTVPLLGIELAAAAAGDGPQVVVSLDQSDAM